MNKITADEQYLNPNTRMVSMINYPGFVAHIEIPRFARNDNITTIRKDVILSPDSPRRRDEESQYSIWATTLLPSTASALRNLRPSAACHVFITCLIGGFPSYY
jgi:hypothetical protein